MDGWEVTGAVAGVICAFASIYACFEARAARVAARGAKETVDALQIQIGSIITKVDTISNSPFARLHDSPMTFSASGGSGGAGGVNGGGGGGGGSGGSFFGGQSTGGAGGPAAGN